MIEQDYDLFLNQNPLVMKLKMDKEMLSPEEMNELERYFKENFPTKNFYTFLADQDIFVDDVCQNVPIFDTKLKKSYNPTVLNPIQRKKTDSFNMREFLLDSIQNNQLCYLNFDPEPEIENDDIFEDETNRISLAREALKDIAKIALFLSHQKKDIPYIILEVHQQRYIN